ncbi:hypothetical protein SEA_PHELPSODU_86 [Mycobacterium phage PhelpsODU]|uniref:Uncharacterized protein n=1 Tax=Mycobacterium phage Unicorn TaxID=2015825 RepID=A0A222ZK33_9CAUD|nr:hypothetical protein I5G78_gp010 [Mycobacterium phage Unicorn]ASR85104.1 hypothetical protein SEA_UNICORN_96 [Mycobacterium phage Unicorn]ASR85194.1 hypothetical protein SEA_PHELPSODU_86 [Mycobacterium phage PhelpsODU]
MSGLDGIDLSHLGDAERQRVEKALQRFNDSMAWQLHHAGQELARDRLRRLFGTPAS